MGAFFHSYDEAWEAFLAREEPLEDFLADWPEDAGYVASAWVIEPPLAVKEAVLRLQSSFAHLDWIVPVPEHFLHVALGPSPWELGLTFPVEIEYRRVGAFHAVVIVEAHCPPLRELVEDESFLPHLTIGVTRSPGPAAPLREALAPLRDTVLGRQRVEEVKLCQFPAARTTLLQPWAVEEVVRLTAG